MHRKEKRGVVDRGWGSGQSVRTGYLGTVRVLFAESWRVQRTEERLGVTKTDYKYGPITKDQDEPTE